MKTRNYFLIGITCAIISFFVANKINVNHMSDSVTLASLVTLAYAENGTDDNENDDNKCCMTDITVENQMQDCQGVNVLGRVSFIYKCKGDNPGYCQEGAEYIYYDCDGVNFKEDNRVNDKSCK